MELNPGSRIGSYEIIALLGVGGMGKVFRARDLQLGREVAIKVLSEEASNDEGRVHRFLTEAKAASALNHPNILTVYGFGEENHSPYIVTELVAGKTLRALVENGPLPTGRVMDISQQTLAGLSKAHGIGIVHRDIKPENLMVSGDNFVKILDFGLAKLLKNEKGSGPLGSLETLDLIATETGLILGTAAYMSPEQARGQPADARSDVFSTGLVIYEMLTGKNPFQRQNFGETISAILRDDPPPFPPSIPQELVRIVEKSVHKEPASRYPSAKEMESDLRKYHTTAITASANSFTSARTIDQLSAPRSAPTTIPVKSGNLTKKSILLASAVILLIVLAIASVRSFKNRAFTPAVPAQPVIAVMAIENATSDPELTSADVGKILSDAFVQILYDYQGVQVVSPLHLTSIITSMNRSFKDTSNDIALVQEVSKESEANTVLSGSLSQIGQSYILTATLTELTSNKLLGSFRAESDGKGSFVGSLDRRNNTPAQ